MCRIPLKKVYTLYLLVHKAILATYSYFIISSRNFQQMLVIFANIIENTGRKIYSMTERPLKIKLSIALDDDIVERIKELAIEDDRSFSSYVNRVLRDHIKQIDQKQTTCTKRLHKALASE